MDRQKKNRVFLTGFTLLELIVVIVIIAILAVISLPQFGKMKETSLDQEAIANLKLIQAAEKIYRMETAFYYPDPTVLPSANTDQMNENLKLAIPTAGTPNWDYKVTATTSTFTANAKRDSREKSIDQDGEVY